MIQFIIIESLAIGVFCSCVWDPDGTGNKMAGFDNSVGVNEDSLLGRGRQIILAC